MEEFSPNTVGYVSLAVKRSTELGIDSVFDLFNNFEQIDTPTKILQIFYKLVE